MRWRVPSSKWYGKALSKEGDYVDEKPVMLIVDDVEINRVVLAQFFQEEYIILEAENGQEALNTVTGQHVDIVLVDLVMPVMDGYEFLTALKASDQFAGLPIIVMTAQSDGDSEARAMQLGAADFITKPYNPTIVRCRIQNVMGRTENEWRRIEQKARERQITEMNRFIDMDQLTEIYNREAFYKRAAQLIKDNKETAYSIVYLDIADFKLVNSLFGQDTGNMILKTAAIYFKMLAGTQGLCCRMEADHFALCLPKEKLNIIHLLEALDGTIASLGISQTVVFYAGIFEVDNPLMGIDQMCDRARMAMHTVKGDYLQRYAVFDDKMQQVLLEEQTIVRGMDFALQSEQFQVFLQPIYDAALGKIVGAEALARWQHPNLGMVLPERFEPLFERNGFIVRLDRYVWMKACEYLSLLREKMASSIPISINISPFNLCNVDLLDYIMGLVQKYNLSPKQLPLEITETAYKRQPQQLMGQVSMFRDNGFQVILDNFGKGCSSLNMVKNLVVDAMKIEMGFAQDLQSSSRSGCVMRNLLSLAEELGVEAVVKGVETQEQLDFVLDCGFSNIQGYYFSKPLPFEEFLKLYERDRV